MSRSFGEASQSAGKVIADLPPLGIVGLPEHVAHLVVYLASDESEFTTGTEHVIDGGLLAGYPTKDQV
jgi:2-keto-3-deoxy-L-fuconate dehydrogenase